MTWTVNWGLPFVHFESVSRHPLNIRDFLMVRPQNQMKLSEKSSISDPNFHTLEVFTYLTHVTNIPKFCTSSVRHRKLTRIEENHPQISKLQPRDQFSMDF